VEGGVSGRGRGTVLKFRFRVKRYLETHGVGERRLCNFFAFELGRTLAVYIIPAFAVRTVERNPDV